MTTLEKQFLAVAEVAKPRFENAPADQKPGTDEALELYALFKIGEGKPAAEASVFNFKRAAMHSAWKKKADSGMTQEEGQKQYIAWAEKLSQKYGFPPILETTN